MPRILVTEMSGTETSSTLVKLDRLGYDVVDTDCGDWTEWLEADGGYVWREQRKTELLARDSESALFGSGTVSKQSRFCDHFDAIVLLSAPASVLLTRSEQRTNNPCAKNPTERQLVLRHLAEVDPMLRTGCTHEIDAEVPLSEVVAQLADRARSVPR